jgi:HD-like signal output (HDOD) protein
MLKKLLKKAEPKKEMRDALGEFELPSFPSIVMNALEIVRDADAPLPAIADVVSTDPGLSVRLLSTVNSAAFGLRHRVKSVHHAVSLLGRSQLESMLISIAVGEALPRDPVPGYEPGRFWVTSARRAVVARALADRLDPSSRSESFTASLLQDMAVPVLCRQRGREYGQLLEHWHQSTEDLAGLERQEYGWDHAGVAAGMCDEWNFPERQACAIAAHHSTDDEGPEPLPAVGLVSVLREVDEQLGVEQLVENAHRRFGMAKDEVAELVQSSFETAAEISELFT